MCLLHMLVFVGMHSSKFYLFMNVSEDKSLLVIKVMSRKHHARFAYRCAAALVLAPDADIMVRLLLLTSVNISQRRKDITKEIY